MKASEIQKARIAEIENQADLMIKEIKVATLTSITRQHILKNNSKASVCYFKDSNKANLELADTKLGNQYHRFFRNSLGVRRTHMTGRQPCYARNIQS